MNVEIVKSGALFSATINLRGVPLLLGFEQMEADAVDWADTTLALMGIHPDLRAPDFYDRQNLNAIEMLNRHFHQ
jgi:hypothetical protein